MYKCTYIYVNIAFITQDDGKVHNKPLFFTVNCWL